MIRLVVCRDFIIFTLKKLWTQLITTKTKLRFRQRNRKLNHELVSLAMNLLSRKRKRNLKWCKKTPNKEKNQSKTRSSRVKNGWKRLSTLLSFQSTQIKSSRKPMRISQKRIRSFAMPTHLTKRLIRKIASLTRWASRTEKVDKALRQGLEIFSLNLEKDWGLLSAQTP